MDLTAQKREIFGKKVKALREQGLIPAELYGKGIENLHLSVSSKDFLGVLQEAGESAVVNIIIDGDKRPVLIQEVKLDPVTDAVLSTDFYQVRLDQKVSVAVPLEFVGESPAVISGGILVKAMQELEVETSPLNIPKVIEVDLAKLKEIDQSLYVKDLVVPSGVEVLVDAETPVAIVKEPISEEREDEMAQEVDVSEIKSEADEKRAQKEGEAATKADETASKDKPEEKEE